MKNEYYKNFELQEAVWHGNFEKVKTLIEEGADVNYISKHGHSLLIMSVSSDSRNSLDIILDITTYLIKAGANINYQDEDGKTALMHAVIGGRFSIVQCLVEAGADINIVGRGLVTADKYALRYAQQTKNCKILEYLTKAAEKNKKAVITELTNMKKLKDGIYHNNGIHQEVLFKKYEPVAVYKNLVDPEEYFSILGDFTGSRRDFLNKLYETNDKGFFVEFGEWVSVCIDDIKTAKECGLIPFKDKGSSLYIILGCPDGEIARLDAYQVLSHGTIDRQSTFFTDKEHFTSIVGNEIVAAMEKILYEE